MGAHTGCMGAHTASMHELCVNVFTFSVGCVFLFVCVSIFFGTIIA